MDLLLEIIFSIIFEGSIEVMQGKKIPVFIRILCAIIAGLIFLFTIGIIGFVAISIWNEYYHIPSILFFILDLAFTLFAIKKIKNELN